MKVLMLSDPGSYHTSKWSNALHMRGIDLFVFGFSKFDKNLYESAIKVESLNLQSEIKKKNDGAFSKLLYLKSLPKVKKIIRDFKPDLIHVQYATSYGFIGSLTNFHPLLIQVWGSDVYNFPSKNILNERLIKYNLFKADRILSTSKCMLQQTQKYTDKTIDFFYLGVDPEVFKPINCKKIFDPKDIVVGTVKTLERKYGIEYLIRSFKICKERYPSISLKLLIVGGGTLESELKKIVKELNLDDDTVFTGFIQPDKIPYYHNMLDIFVTLSIEDSESFGLSVIEASACEKPVIVSDVGGLPEAVENNNTGFVVESKNIDKAADALTKLILNEKLRKEMGKTGRDRVVKYFNWNDKVTEMINLYQQMI